MSGAGVHCDVCTAIVDGALMWVLSRGALVNLALCSTIGIRATTNGRHAVSAHSELEKFVLGEFETQEQAMAYMVDLKDRLNATTRRR